MRLIYLANIRLPTEKAHGLQIMKTCEALFKQGMEVELIVPRRLNHLKDDPFMFYDVKKNFKITKAWCLDLISLKIFGVLGFWIESWTFYRSIKKYLREQSGAVYYTRDLSVAYWLSKTADAVYYEVHTMPDKISLKYKEAWGRCKGFVVISDGLNNELKRQGISEEKIVVARDAVDVGQSLKPNNTNVPLSLPDLPHNKKIVLYTGHLYEWKGAKILVEAAKYITDPAIEICLVGGTATDITSFRKRYQNIKNVHIIDWQDHKLVPLWLKSAHVLVLPTSAKEKIGAIYTSPMKLFEYMMSKRPIVASNIPSLREVLDETTATFFEPDNPKSLAETIQGVLANPIKAKAKAWRAYEIVLEKYSWDKRAELIKKFISKV